MGLSLAMLFFMTYGLHEDTWLACIMEQNTKLQVLALCMHSLIWKLHASAGPSILP